jgi:hypothetical protein
MVRWLIGLAWLVAAPGSAQNTLYVAEHLNWRVQKLTLKP